MKKAKHTDIGSGRDRRFGRGVSTSGATVALAGVLVVCLIAAGLLVAARAGNRQARQRGERLIEQMSQAGLESYLGRERIVRYHLLESEGQTVGYGGYSVTGVLEPDGGVVFKGSQLDRYPSQRVHSETEFEVANDLSEFWHRESTIRGNNRPESASYRLSGNRLIASRNRQRLPAVVEVTERNIVPLGLLDFFSSVAVTQVDEPVAFSVILRGSERESLFILHECVVEAGGDVPAEVAAVQGQAVSTYWPATKLRQRLYCDPQHQVVWQENAGPSGVVLRAVTQARLLKVFPEAQLLLGNWLGAYDEQEQKGVF